MEVRYVAHLGLRVELEQVTFGGREWWAARVLRTPAGSVGRLPLSYAPRPEQAVEDAVQMWTRLTLPDLSD